MIRFQNTYFVKNKKLLDNKAAGIYKKYKRFILIKDRDDKPFAYIHQMGWIANAGRQDNGKLFFQYGLSSWYQDEYFSELNDMNYSEESEYIKNIYNSI